MLLLVEVVALKTTSKQRGELRIELPKYGYVMYNLRKSNFGRDVGFSMSPLTLYSQVGCV